MQMSYDEIKQCCNEIKLINTNILTDVHKIAVEKGKINSGTIWASAASSNYSSKLNSLIEGFSTAYNSLNAYVNAMISSVENYEEVDKLIGQKLESIIR